MNILEPRKLGKTDLLVSPICIGAWQLGGPVSISGKPDGHPDPGKQNVIKMIAELHDLGINFIDTAEGYSGGESERRIAQAIKGQRDQWVISSKFGYRVDENEQRDDSSEPETIMRSLEGSLQRLETDHLDVYLYHCPPELSGLEKAREILEQARACGKIRHYGISSNDLPLIKELHARDMLDVLQYDTSLIRPEEEICSFARENQIGTQLRGVMANGRLSGKYFKSQPVWRSDDNRAQYHNQRDFSVYAPLQDLVPPEYTMAQCSIRLLLDRPGVHSICMGAKNIDDYKTALEAVTLPVISKEATSSLWKRAAELSALPGA